METNDLPNQTRQFTETAQQTAQQVKEKAQEWSAKAKSTARDAGAAADLYVHEYAWTSVILIAAAAGLIGYLLALNRR